MCLIYKSIYICYVNFIYFDKLIQNNYICKRNYLPLGPLCIQALASKKKGMGEAKKVLGKCPIIRVLVEHSGYSLSNLF